MTDRPDLDEEYMKDAIATAKQMGAVVKDAPAAKAPSHIVQGDDAAIDEHIAEGVKRGTITDATPQRPVYGKFTESWTKADNHKQAGKTNGQHGDVTGRGF